VHQSGRLHAGSDLVEKALRQADLVIVQDAYHPTETTRFADVLLPAAQWPEKDGVMTNWSAG
jgi:ferredoxin-nitrate reductase